MILPFPQGFLTALKELREASLSILAFMRGCYPEKIEDAPLKEQCQQFESGLVLNCLLPCYETLMKQQTDVGFNDEKDMKSMLKLSENCQVLQQLCFLARYPSIVFE